MSGIRSKMFGRKLISRPIQFLHGKLHVFQAGSLCERTTVALGDSTATVGGTTAPSTATAAMPSEVQMRPLLTPPGSNRILAVTAGLEQHDLAPRVGFPRDGATEA